MLHTRDGGCHSGRDGTGIAIHGVNFAIAQSHDQSIIAVKGPERNLLYRHLAAQIGVAYGLVVAGLSILVQADKAVGAAADDSILPTVVLGGVNVLPNVLRLDVEIASHQLEPLVGTGFLQNHLDGVLVHLLSMVHIGAVTGFAHIDVIIEGKQHIVHGQGLPIMPGDALVQRQVTGDGSRVFTDRPICNKEWLYLAVGPRLPEGRCHKGVIAHLPKCAALHKGGKGVVCGGGPEVQLLHHAGGGAARRFGRRALRCALRRRLRRAAEQAQRQRAG